MPRGGAPPENPFRYGDVATGRFFTDREAELRELVGDVGSGQNVLILSPVGIATHYNSLSIRIRK